MIPSLYLYCSSLTTDKPTLAERILEVPKSYIYIPEKGVCTHTSMIFCAFNDHLLIAVILDYGTFSGKLTLVYLNGLIPKVTACCCNGKS